jgi:hypothetical protein
MATSCCVSGLKTASSLRGDRDFLPDSDHGCFRFVQAKSRFLSQTVLHGLLQVKFQNLFDVLYQASLEAHLDSSLCCKLVPRFDFKSYSRFNTGLCFRTWCTRVDSSFCVKLCSRRQFRLFSGCRVRFEIEREDMPLVVLGIAFQMLLWVVSEVVFRGLFEIRFRAVHEAVSHELLSIASELCLNTRSE